MMLTFLGSNKLMASEWKVDARCSADGGSGQGSDR